MKLYFTTDELCITDTPLPLHVAEKLWKHHILVMNPIREKLGHAITASQKSGFRPYEWEKSHGRSGGSQHTFGDLPHGANIDMLGAVDWTTLNKSKLDDLQALLISDSPYTRIARYNSFIHCDYKPTGNGKRQLFKSNSASQWTLISEF